MKKLFSLLAAVLLGCDCAFAQPSLWKPVFTPNKEVTAGMQYGSKMLFGGEFTQVNSAAYNHVVFYDPATATVQSAGSLSSVPDYMCWASDGRIRATGNFPVAGERYGAMIYDPGFNNWIPDPTTRFTGPHKNQQRIWFWESLGIFNSDVVVGDMQEINSVAVNQVTHIFNGVAVKIFNAIECWSCSGNKAVIEKVYAGLGFMTVIGAFTKLDAVSATNVAKLSVGINPQSTQGFSVVTDYIHFQGKEVVTGSFSFPKPGAIQWDGTSWSAVKGGVDIKGNVLEIVCGTLFVAGEESTFGGCSNEGIIASTNGTTPWKNESAGLNRHGTEEITGLIKDTLRGHVYALGSFKKNKGDTADYIAVRNLGCGILPITLHSFNVKLVDDKVHLNWVADMDEEHNTFLIECSTDGGVFKTIASISGNRWKREYSYIDNSPKGKVLYYRIFYNNKAYSRIITVSLRNQTKPTAFIRFGMLHVFTQEPAFIQVIDVGGRIIVRQKINNNNESIPLPKNLSGNIIVSLFSIQGKNLLSKQINVDE